MKRLGNGIYQRHYCAKGRVDGAFITGKTWNIPERSNKKKEQATLMDILQMEKKRNIQAEFIIKHRLI